MEAMQAMWVHVDPIWDGNIHVAAMFDGAADAFADQECGTEAEIDHPHAPCRASLRAEIRGER